MLGPFRLWLPSWTSYVTHFMSCWYQSDARQDKVRLFEAALLWISKVQGYGHVCSTWSAKKNTQRPAMMQQSTLNALF